MALEVAFIGQIVECSQVPFEDDWGELTNHVSGSMEDWSNVGSESCRCCWIWMLLGIGLDAAQSASSMPQSLVVYFSGVDRRSGWDLVQSMATPCRRRALMW